MLELNPLLELDRCPHCGVASPLLSGLSDLETQDRRVGVRKMQWRIYGCSRCGGLVTATAPAWGAPVEEYFPQARGADPELPPRAREYLQQALDSLHSPAGSVMLAAAAVDAMLKAHNLSSGTLNQRINEAAARHLITKEMAEWAHDVRLDANDQRHADDAAALPSIADARRCVDFVQALGQFLFVLPARVKRGRSEGGAS